jgi:hypothetical protein
MKEKLVNIIKTYGAAFMTIVAVVSFIYAAGIKSERKDSGNVKIISDISVIKDSINSISTQLRPIKDQLSNVAEKQVESKNAYNALRLVVLDMASKSPGMTIDQFKQYMESVPELKKNLMLNQLYLQNPIPYNGSLILTSK